MRSWIERHERPWTAALLVAGCAFAWTQRFVLDDAYISFQYARNLAEGHGLVWQPGERVEGYTNFLWTAWLALPHALGLDPVRFVHAHVPLFAIATLLGARALAERAGADATGRLLVLVLLASQPSVAAFSSGGGLETGAVTALGVVLLALAADAFVAERLGVARALLLGLGSSALLLLRLDALWIGAGVGLLACAAAARRSGRERARLVAALAAPPTLLLGAWFAWRLSYYGAWLPNTFHAKATDAQLLRGLRYLAVFASSTWILVALAPVVAALAARVRDSAGFFVYGVVAASLLAHVGWVAWVGGDFMEFRFLVPALPLLFALFGAALCALDVPGALRAALAVAVLLGSLNHFLRFEFGAGIETVPGLAAHLEAPDQDWRGIGRALADAFPDGDVTIAVGPAGVIPYRSRLRAVDMLGLNDRRVARHGIPVHGQPGHARVAPLSYLVERDVHLVIGHPWLLGPHSPAWAQPRVRGLAGFGYLVDATPQSVPPSASLLEIPIGGGRRLVTLYLTPHVAIERAARRGGWKRHPLPGRSGGA